MVPNMTKSLRPTSKDVATLAGVSQTTVSLVARGKKSITPETTKRVREAMEKLDYHPNIGARMLKNSKTNIIGLFVDLKESNDANQAVPYIDEIVNQASEKSYDVILNSNGRGITGLQHLSGKSICDAYIFMDVSDEDERISYARDLNIPIVLMGRPKDPDGFDVVDIDSRAAGCMAVGELVKTGHHHIAVVGEPLEPAPHLRFIDEFYIGVKEEATLAGIDLKIVPRLTEDWSDLENVGGQLLENKGDRLGLIVRDSKGIQWLMKLLDLHDLVAGKDVSVVAHCQDCTVQMFSTPVTNIPTMPREEASAAVRILFNRLEGMQSAPVFELIKPTGVIRRSTTMNFE
jgi:DNA-binding LacI/PurR family transcriptional regulator